MAIIKQGIVLSGENMGWVIAIDDDQDGATGGFYLFLQSTDGKGFDYWFENEKQLHAQLEEFYVKWISVT